MPYSPLNKLTDVSIAQQQSTCLWIGRYRVRALSPAVTLQLRYDLHGVIYWQNVAVNSLLLVSKQQPSSHFLCKMLKIQFVYKQCVYCVYVFFLTHYKVSKHYKRKLTNLHIPAGFRTNHLFFGQFSVLIMSSSCPLLNVIILNRFPPEARESNLIVPLPLTSMSPSLGS